MTSRQVRGEARMPEVEQARVHFPPSPNVGVGRGAPGRDQVGLVSAGTSAEGEAVEAEGEAEGDIFEEGK